MPTEFYIAAAVGMIVLVVLGSLFRRKPKKRRVVQMGVSSTDQATIQLSRIADALERVVVQLEASPSSLQQPSKLSPTLNDLRVNKTPAPPPEQVPKAPEPSTEQRNGGEPTKPHVNLSMFGR